MISQGKIKEIKRMLKNRIPEGEIKEILKSEGYSKEDIEQLFQPHKYDMRSWYLCFAILLLVIGLWIFLRKGSLVLFIFSGLLFFSYYKETERVKTK